MADLNERLERLISDQDSMKKILELAQNILAQRDSGDAASAGITQPGQQQESMQSPDLSSVLSSLLTQTSSEDQQPDTVAFEEPSQGSAAFAAILPQLMQVLSGQGDLVKQERATLVRAMRPYLKSGRSNSIERALRMANLTKAATNALHTLGR